MRVVYLVAFLMAIKVSAQGFEFNSDKIKGIIENQIQSLDLKESQKIEFKKLNVKYLIKLKHIKDSSKAKFEKLQDLKKVMKERDNQVKLLLDKKQFKVYKENQKEYISII